MSTSQGVSVLVLAPTRELVLQLAATSGETATLSVKKCRLPPGQSCQQAAAVQWRIGSKLFRGWRLFGSGRAENQGDISYVIGISRFFSKMTVTQYLRHTEVHARHRNISRFNVIQQATDDSVNENSEIRRLTTPYYT